MDDFDNIKIFWPTHAYVPGKNARHPENAFESITSAVLETHTIEQLRQSAAFQHGLIYLHHGFYWEAHEMLEPIWQVLPNDTPQRWFVQGLIQLANAYLKRDMQRTNASLRLCQLSRELIARSRDATVMGVDRESVLVQIHQLEQAQINAL